MQTAIPWALCAILAAMHTDTDEQPRIVIDPKPPTAGQVVTLKAGPNMKRTVEVTPGGTTTVATDANGDASYTVPAGSGTMIVSDSTGQYQSDSTIVVP